MEEGEIEKEEGMEVREETVEMEKRLRKVGGGEKGKLKEVEE